MIYIQKRKEIIGVTGEERIHQFQNSEKNFENIQVVEDINKINTCLEGYSNDESLDIFLDPGIYQGRIEIQHPHVWVYGLGHTSEQTVISGNLSALEVLDNGEKRGTFRTYTMLLDGDDCRLYNLTIENTAGQGNIAGQCIALYAEGNGILIEKCRLLGHQDTLFTGPLPEKELLPGGFRGPKQYAKRMNGIQTYRQCYICGTIDFIFGSATAYFEECEIHSLYAEEGGFVTAPSTTKENEIGYVFDQCKFTGEGIDRVYLGRPWRNYGKVTIQDSYLGSHIKTEGWDDWGKEDAHKTAVFFEKNNNGPGANGKRPDWVKVI